MKYNIKSKRKLGKFVAKTTTLNSVIDGYKRSDISYHKTRKDAEDAVKSRRSDYYNDPYVDRFFSKIYKPVRFYNRKRKI